jgi:hypothetical protein
MWFLTHYRRHDLLAQKVDLLLDQRQAGEARGKASVCQPTRSRARPPQQQHANDMARHVLKSRPAHV